MAEYLWGIDLGGTKIECVVLDASLNVINRQRIPTLGDQGYEKVLSQIETLIKKVSSAVGSSPSKIGFGTPGSINPDTQKLRNCNSVYLNGHTFKTDVESLLGIPIEVSNDANCFALSEFQIGVINDQFPDANTVFGIIMGTGVGSGIIANRELVSGKNGIGGEWGHNFLDESGGDCYCGKSGCVERVLSGPSLESYYEKLSGKKNTLKNIAESYRMGNDPFADQTMKRLFHFFAKAVSNVINILDPDVVVIGGGVGNIDELYTEGIAQLNEFVFSDYVETKFVKPLLGDSSGVFGAALL